jgi:cell division protein FtsB
MKDLPKEAEKLTREALEDDWVGLHEENAELRATAKQLKAELATAKAQLKEALAGDDMGRSLGNAMRQRDTAKQRMKDEQTKNARLQRRVDAQAAEIKELRAKLEKQEIEL